MVDRYKLEFEYDSADLVPSKEGDLVEYSEYKMLLDKYNALMVEHMNLSTEHIKLQQKYDVVADGLYKER